MGKAKVLIVEDNADLAELYAEVLKAEGHRTLIASTSAQAIKWLKQRRIKPDAVLLDMNLPDQSGLTVLSVIRRLPWLAKTRVIVSSGSSDLARQAINGWGADLLLPKPISMEHLLTAVVSA